MERVLKLQQAKNKKYSIRTNFSPNEFRVKKGDVILVHAAAGGMGLILCQWAKHLGATIIGTVSSEEKSSKSQRCRL